MSFVVILIFFYFVSVVRVKNIVNEIEDLYLGMLIVFFFLGRNVVCYVLKIYWFKFEFCVMKVYCDGVVVVKSRIRLILLCIERFYKLWLYD